MLSVKNFKFNLSAHKAGDSGKNKGNYNMEVNMVKTRFIAALLLVALTVSLSAVYSSAFAGSGVEVMSREIKVVKSALLGRKLTFSDADFKCAFAVDDFEKITVTALPSSNDGTLLLAGRRVREGQDIKRKNIAALVFVPVDKSVDEAEFSFTLDGGTECICRMRFLERMNYAPKVADEDSAVFNLFTQERIGVFGKMSAEDPEGDSLEYIIAAYPKYGRLELVGDDGRYSYTPSEGFTGYDAFTFAVRDEYGNYSEAREVVLKVGERMSEVVYCDMLKAEEYNAAVVMNAMGIMSGKLIGDDMYFMPDESVTRAEFVSMALKAAGIRADVGESFFDDNDSIPTSLRGYVAAAARRGIVDGSASGASLIFRPNDGITVYEAAAIMCAILGEAGEEASEYSTLDGVPVWARGASGAMMTLGILDDDTEDLSATVTRGDAAEFLYRMVNNS